MSRNELRGVLIGVALIFASLPAVLFHREGLGVVLLGFGCLVASGSIPGGAER